MAVKVYKSGAVIKVEEAGEVDQIFVPSSSKYRRLNGFFILRDNISKIERNIGEYTNVLNENGTPYTSEQSLEDFLDSAFASPTVLSNEEGQISTENPLQVNNDEVTVNDVDWDASDFTGWVGNPKDIFGNVNNGGLYNESGDNPKVFTLRLKRTKKMRDFGIGTNLNSFSNLKATILGSSDSERGILDLSLEPHKDASWVYSQEEFAFNALRVEFFTDDRVDVTNLFLKYTPSSRKQNYTNKWGLNPDVDSGETEDIWPLGDLFSFTTIPQAYYFSSSSTLDVGKIIRAGFVYINADGRKQAVTTELTLNGQNKTLIPGISTFIGCNRGFIVIPVGGGELDGDVYIYEDDTVSGGIPDDLSKVKAFVDSELGQTSQAIYSCPEFTESGQLIAFAEIYRWYAKATRSRTTEGLVTLFVAENGLEKRGRDVDGLGSGLASGREFRENTPEIINPGADVWVRVSDLNTNNVAITAGFTIKEVVL